uniref:Uncharacterized protein n=1 Tax=Nelumbo nucifera TaxID=4432 RepID=A0A822ZHA4_NELNU|nr:TPA_asm: hypothetical protein HUJ06_001281 [Nelumbo nucifera]
MQNTETSDRYPYSSCQVGLLAVNCTNNIYLQLRRHD